MENVSDVVDESDRDKDCDSEPRPPDTKEASAIDSSPIKESGSISLPEEDSRYQALSDERDAFQKEVAQIRETLEAVQEKHREELSGLQGQLVTTREEKDHAEAQYRGLLGKVSTIRSQLGERLKADAVGLATPSDLSFTYRLKGGSFASTESYRRSRGTVYRSS